MFEARIESCEDLTEEERMLLLPVDEEDCKYSYGKFLRVLYNGDTILLESDNIPQEDVSFVRDLAWVRDALIKCYELGKSESE